MAVIAGPSRGGGKFRRLVEELHSVSSAQLLCMIASNNKPQNAGNSARRRSGVEGENDADTKERPSRDRRLAYERQPVLAFDAE